MAKGDSIGQVCVACAQMAGANDIFQGNTGVFGGHPFDDCGDPLLFLGL